MRSWRRSKSAGELPTSRGIPGSRVSGADASTLITPSGLGRKFPNLRTPSQRQQLLLPAKGTGCPAVPGPLRRTAPRVGARAAAVLRVDGLPDPVGALNDESAAGMQLEAPVDDGLSVFEPTTDIHQLVEFAFTHRRIHLPLSIGVPVKLVPTVRTRSRTLQFKFRVNAPRLRLPYRFKPVIPCGWIGRSPIRK